MKVGVLIVVNDAEIEEKFKRVHDLGLESCQITCWNHSILTDETAEKINAACKKYGIKISTVWVGWSGPTAWNFTEGPSVLGIVPVEYRYSRMKQLIHGSDFAKKLGVNQIATHFGFLPENPADAQYMPILAAIRMLADHCKANGQYLLFETGQETPVTILRFIEDSERDNLGVNLDAANLIMYGKANPVDSLTVFGKYVRDVHAKDGDYPTNGRRLGEEKALGEGSVNYPAFVKKLREVGYDGPLTIEREIEGEKQTQDILKAKAMLEALIAENA